MTAPLLVAVPTVVHQVAGGMRSVEHLVDTVAVVVAVSGEQSGWIGHVLQTMSVIQQLDSNHVGSSLRPGVSPCIALMVLLLVLHMAITAASVGAAVGAQRAQDRIRAWLQPLFTSVVLPRQLPSRPGPSLIEVTVPTPVSRRVGSRRRRRGPPSAPAATACV